MSIWFAFGDDFQKFQDWFGSVMKETRPISSQEAPFVSRVCQQTLCVGEGPFSRLRIGWRTEFDRHVVRQTGNLSGWSGRCRVERSPVRFYPIVKLRTTFIHFPFQLYKRVLIPSKSLSEGLELRCRRIRKRYSDREEPWRKMCICIGRTGICSGRWD